MNFDALYNSYPARRCTVFAKNGGGTELRNDGLVAAC